MSDIQAPSAVIEQPRVKVVDFTKEELPRIYQELLLNNGLLARVEQSLKLKGWTELEIRTAQLQVAVKSNQSIQRQNEELKLTLQQRLAQ